MVTSGEPARMPALFQLQADEGLSRIRTARLRPGRDCGPVPRSPHSTKDSPLRMPCPCARHSSTDSAQHRFIGRLDHAASLVIAERDHGAASRAAPCAEMLILASQPGFDWCYDHRSGTRNCTPHG